MELGVSYVSAHLPGHIENDMEHLKEIGCTEVLFALQENHIIHLTGALKYGAGIAVEKGLRPYAVIWGYANTFGGGQISKFMLENLDVWRVEKDGTLAPRACLNNPRVVDRFVEITGLCRDNGYQGIFVDEPTPQVCFCGICRQMYYNELARDLAQDEGSPEYETFRRNTVRNYTENLCRRVKELDSSMKTMACVMPVDKECFEAVGSIPDLDIFGTDPYWLLSGESLETAVEQTRMAKAVCDEHGKESQVWLNCWAIREGLEEQIYSGGKVLAGVGCDSMYTWSFRGALGTSEECARPAVAWSGVEKLYRELSGV